MGILDQTTSALGGGGKGGVQAILLQQQQVLGANALGDMAEKAGVAAPEAANLMSGLLPQAIDKLSPGGKAPAANDLGGLLSSVGKLLG
jgi:uncharacterized protein YidB (DUF937 family)